MCLAGCQVCGQLGDIQPVIAGRVELDRLAGGQEEGWVGNRGAEYLPVWPERSSEPIDLIEPCSCIQQLEVKMHYTRFSSRDQ
jgi:hypothetical protein